LQKALRRSSQNLVFDSRYPGQCVMMYLILEICVYLYDFIWVISYWARLGRWVMFRSTLPNSWSLNSTLAPQTPQTRGFLIRRVFVQDRRDSWASRGLTWRWGHRTSDVMRINDRVFGVSIDEDHWIKGDPTVEIRVMVRLLSPLKAINTGLL